MGEKSGHSFIIMENRGTAKFNEIRRYLDLLTVE